MTKKNFSNNISIIIPTTGRPETLDNIKYNVNNFMKNNFSVRNWGPGNSPKTAVWEYLKTHNEFEIDNKIHNKLLITACPDGYLKRIKE